MTPQTQMKQIALIVVTILNACPGNSLLSKAPTETTIVETNKAFAGTWFLFNFENLFDACC